MNNVCFAARPAGGPSDRENRLACVDSKGNLREWAGGEGRVAYHAERFSICRKQRRFSEFSVKSGESDLDDAMVV